MKRITEITVENYRAFYDSYSFDLKNGENLLLYGENGSGKSSLFKGLNQYFESSRNESVPFISNSHNATNNGKIQLSFHDFADFPGEPVDGTKQELTFSNQDSTNNVQFIQNTELVKGFFDYRSLLDVYNHKEANPNLFELIVLNILGQQLNVAKTFRFADKWKQLQNNLIKNSYTRNDWTHRTAKQELPEFQLALETSLKRIFKEVNELLLRKYFPELNIEIRFVLQPTEFNYKRWKWQWYTTADLRLEILHNGSTIQSDYTDYLNEARLSAIAVCIYLAALKTNPEEIEYKILFLDDIFVGLDTGNRIPILDILINEFKNYQIILSSYDRHLYELAKRKFDNEASGQWVSSELYVGKKDVGANTIDKPIHVVGITNFDKGVKYLHDREQPDYPASANYFRKYAEEIITTYIPDHELRDNEDYSLIEGYKLNKLVNSALKFIGKISADSSLIIRLKAYITCLLHPLSHYELTSPLYKKELLEIESILVKLNEYLRDLKSTYQFFIPEGRKITLNFNVSPSETGHYEILLKETLYIFKTEDGSLYLSPAQMEYNSCYTIVNSTRNQTITFPKVKCAKLEDVYQIIHAKVITTPAYSHIPISHNIHQEFSYQNGDGEHSIEHHKSLITW